MVASGKTLRVGMLGCGIVGSEVARLLVANAEDLSARSGAKLELVKIAVRDTKRVRPGIPSELFTMDLKSIVEDPNIDLVIEVMGGIDPAHELILSAMKNGKAVVTANKALLAKHGWELFHASDEADVDLYYEAAVAGAIPILRPMAESLVGDHVERVMGIVNGTTNYILTNQAHPLKLRLKRHKHLALPKQIQLPMLKVLMLQQRRQSWPAWHFTPTFQMLMFIAKVSLQLPPTMSRLQRRWDLPSNFLQSPKPMPMAKPSQFAFTQL
jgi:Homoserine dehydrogenase, NAD binding domain/Homoserine dehydrogenase